MHSLSLELLNLKVIYLGNSAIMKRKEQKLKKLSKAELVTIASEVRAELSQPWITDVLQSNIVTKQELICDILSTIQNSVSNNLKTIFCTNGR